MTALLLDTHALVWWLENSDRLSETARSAIAKMENAVFVSAATGWEIATKFRIGKLPSVEPVVHDLPAVLRREGFQPLAVTMAHAQRAGLMDGAHKDPFDRLIAAQALIEDFTVISNDAALDAFDVRRLW